MATELEVKQTAADASVLARIKSDPRIAQLSCAETVTQMETVYYDTAAGDLGRRKWTLRLRREGETAVVCMKTAGDGLRRGEWEYGAADLTDAAERLCALGAPAALREILRTPLTAVCGAKFARTAIRILLEDGSEAELALDAGILRRGEKTAPLCETELELKCGGETEMLRFAAYLRETYALTPEPKSKFCRAAML